MSITYQRTEDDDPQPVDEHGYLPDGTQVIYGLGGSTITFGPGVFKQSKAVLLPSALEDEE